MRGTVATYDDGRTRLDESGILLRRYYFPLGRARHIPWESVRAAHTGDLRLVNGRWRLWGSAIPRVWLGLDLRRPSRSTLVVLDVGRRIKPAFTPADPPAALAVLTTRARLDS